MGNELKKRNKENNDKTTLGTKRETEKKQDSTNKRQPRSTVKKPCLVKECDDSQIKTKLKAPIPKDCREENFHHLFENGLHCNRSDLLKGYGGTCPECNIKPKAERKNSKIPLSSLMKTHLLYNCEIYSYSIKYKPL